MMFSVDISYNSAECHVDRCGQKGWSNEGEEALDDIWKELAGTVDRLRSSDVTDGLDCRG